MVANYSNLEGMKFIEFLMAYPSGSTKPNIYSLLPPIPYVDNPCYTSKFGEKRLKTQQSKQQSNYQLYLTSLGRKDLVQW